MSELARDLRRIFARGIGLSEDYFEDKFDRHHSSLRVIDYVDQTEEPLPGQLRAGEHTDYGFLTILRSEDSSGGLQVRPHNGDWMDVPTVADSFVVNIGDVMMRWTNDRWVSTLHRVVNPPSRHQPSRRISIPFFHNPNVDAVVECLDAFRDADHCRSERASPVLDSIRCASGRTTCGPWYAQDGLDEDREQSARCRRRATEPSRAAPGRR
jgi:isopenicillin N synthase-like dioxygenase